MPALHVRNVPEEVVAALKRRAAAGRRSLQMELILILEEAAEQAPPREPLPPIQLTYSHAAPDSDWGRDEIYGDDGR